MRTFIFAVALGTGAVLAGAMLAAPAMTTSAMAYDGTKCKAAGNCWEPKPGFPEKIAGSKYDPKHDPKELNKQSESIKGMEERNARRIEAAKKSGKFEYDVTKLSSN